MRLALFTETFLPKIDGIVNTLCHLLDYLAQRGHEALLFAPKGGPARYAGTNVVALEGIPFPFYPELKLVPPIAAGIDQYLARFSPDLVHVINPVSLGLAGLQAAQRLGLPIVASYHTDIPGYTDRYGLSFSKELVWSFFRWIHNQADLNLCPSQATEVELLQQGFKRLRVWSRGVDTAHYHPRRRSDEWRRRLGSTNEPPSLLMLYVGRLSVEKRVDWLLPVIQALPQAHLAIVGDGPLRPSLETLFSDTPTCFTGYLSGEDLANAYAAADLFVFPAANETFGNVVLEAMASGLPVIAPRSGGVIDSILDQETGLLPPPEDQMALVKAVCWLAENPQVVQTMRRAGRRRAEARSWESVFDTLIDDYATLIQSKPHDQIRCPKAEYNPLHGSQGLAAKGRPRSAPADRLQSPAPGAPR